MYMYIYTCTYTHTYTCDTLQRTATHCNTLQHTATHCNKNLVLDFITGWLNCYISYYRISHSHKRDLSTHKRDLFLHKRDLLTHKRHWFSNKRDEFTHERHLQVTGAWFHHRRNCNGPLLFPPILETRFPFLFSLFEHTQHTHTHTHTQRERERYLVLDFITGGTLMYRTIAINIHTKETYSHTKETCSHTKETYLHLHTQETSSHKKYKHSHTHRYLALDLITGETVMDCIIAIVFKQKRHIHAQKRHIHTQKRRAHTRNAHTGIWFSISSQVERLWIVSLRLTTFRKRMLLLWLLTWV